MSFDPLQLLSERFQAAIRAAFPLLEGDPDPLISAARNPQFGDFQSNAAMPLGKALGKPPREVAAAIVKHLDIADIAEPVTDKAIAGPGFINIRLRPDALAALLGTLDATGLGLDAADAGATHDAHPVVVDLCGVNLAKQMHVGHLRSILIGDALVRTLTRLGRNVLPQNHVGDWGLPIAMVVTKLAALSSAGKLDLDTLKLDDLEKHYRDAQAECAADEAGLAAAKKWWSHPKAVAELDAQVSGARESLAAAKATLVKLQTHDAATLAVWQRIVDITMRECLNTCVRLNADIRPEHSAGESSYAEELAPMVADLLARGVAEYDDGAVVVRVEGIEEPCLIQKSPQGGGGYLYATTDLAAVRRRVQKLGASRVIYCVDARQSLHFRQVFGAARKAGFDVLPDGTHALLEHAANGTILGEDGKPFKTRSGDNVKLADLIDEAIERAGPVIAAKNPDLSAAELAATAKVLGVAAIRYAELSSDRARDYVFSFDRMLAAEGNTGPYLLYALVRIKSIFRKAGDALPGFADAAVMLNTPEEKTLALALLRFPSAARSVADALEPHRMCQYLYDLAGAFSAFFTACPVLKAETPQLLASRLRLCDLTRRVLEEGFQMLGIPTVERM